MLSNVAAESADAVYLNPMVKLEPLVCRWYAWSHLIAPAQLALHINYRILPLLQSFATNTSVHVSANNDPNMYGGPFVSLSESDVEEVKALIESTQIQCADLITLAKELRELDSRLQDKANGFSLSEFYTQLPASLQGLVELLYDIHHRPSVRLFESMLYETNMVAPMQEIMLHATGETDRHFFMSTPRLEHPDKFFFKMRFSDKRLDALARMRSEPASFDAIANLLEVDEADKPTFRKFFSAQAPQRHGARDYSEGGMRMRFFGHACVLFQTAHVSILLDPFVGIEDTDENRFTINDLPETIDYVVISHSHQDHFNAEMLIQLRYRIKRVIVPANNSGNITDPSMKLTLKELGFENVDVLDCMDEIQVPGGQILSLPFTGEHADLAIYSKQAIVLTLEGKKFMFLVDSDGRDIALYQRLKRKIGEVDVLFIGMECAGAPLNWLYEPLLGKPVNRRNNESRRLSGADCERAWNILAEVKSPRVFVYAMGQEPWMRYIMGLEYTADSVQLTESDKFVKQCIENGIEAERLYLRREVIF